MKHANSSKWAGNEAAGLGHLNESRRDIEMRAWAQVMGTTTERLQRAVNAVGISPRKVRSYLRDQASPR